MNQYERRFYEDIHKLVIIQEKILKELEKINKPKQGSKNYIRERMGLPLEGSKNYIRERMGLPLVGIDDKEKESD